MNTSRGKEETPRPPQHRQMLVPKRVECYAFLGHSARCRSSQNTREPRARWLAWKKNPIDVLKTIFVIKGSTHVLRIDEDVANSILRLASGISRISQAERK